MARHVTGNFARYSDAGVFESGNRYSRRDNTETQTIQIPDVFYTKSTEVMFTHIVFQLVILTI